MLFLFFTLLHVAFFQIWDNTVQVIFITFIPFFLYFTWKVLEWKHIRIKLTFKKLWIIGLTVFGILMFTWVPDSWHKGEKEIKEMEENIEKEIVKVEQEVITERSIIPKEAVVIKEPMPIQKNMASEESPVLEVNFSELVQKCDSLCRTDSKSYCTVINEAIFSQTAVSYGSCRSLAKYNKSFHRCTGFCEGYGENKWPNSKCTLATGTIDLNCDGI